MPSVLLVGGTGHLGALVAAALLSHTKNVVILAARAGHGRDDIIEKVKAELDGEPQLRQDLSERLIITSLPAIGDRRSFRELLAEHQIEEIINCAGSVDYFNQERLREANVDLVNDILSAAKSARISRFIHVSTAFCSGYVDGEIPEALHEEPRRDPTIYTYFKRQAERLIAESGIPFVILRPSIVIGDSRNGRYSGKPYGLYQFWWSYETLLTDRYRENLHVIAPRRPLHLLHQDAFTAVVLAAREKVPLGSFINLVSSQESLPTVEELFCLWCLNIARPHRLFLHRNLAEAPTREMDLRFRTCLGFVATNMAISEQDWRFQRSGLERLINAGLTFPDVTIRTIEECQTRYVASSNALRQYRERFLDQFPQETAVLRSK